jgi:clan AA aspartic protease (TIGR02281 family)
VATTTAGENGTFRFEVIVNSRLAAKALVDTGATAVVLCRNMARSLGLKPGKPARVATVNGQASAEWTLLASIEIAKTITIPTVRAMVMIKQDCDEIILGMSALRELHAVLVVGQTLILSGPASPPLAGREP